MFSAIIEILSCGPYVTYNNRGPRLSYDWLLLKHPRESLWEVLLKIKKVRDTVASGRSVWKMEASGNGLLTTTTTYKCFKAEPIKEHNNKDNHANSIVPQRFKLTQNSLLATCNWCAVPSEGILWFGIQNSRLAYKGRAALLNSFVSSATENFMRSKFSLSLTTLIQFLPFLIAAFNAVIVLMTKIRSPFEQKCLTSHSKASVVLSPGTVLRRSPMIRSSLDSSSQAEN